MGELLVLGSDEALDREWCSALPFAGGTAFRSPDGRLLLPAFRGRVVDVGKGDLPADEDGIDDLALRWVGAVREHDWSALRGMPLEVEGDWLDLRTAMVRVGWGPQAAQDAWEASRQRPYSPHLPTAAGWAAAGWVVPAVGDDPDPLFAKPVLERSGLLRWAYIARWQQPSDLPEPPLPVGAEASDPGWAEVHSRLRQDHYTGDALAEAEDLAVEILTLAGLGPRSADEAEDEPLPDRDIAAACTSDSPLVRDAAWFLLRAEADAWLACAYAECQHHWAVEAEEDAYELDEVLELAGYGVANPVDAARTRRRLLTLAFGDVRDVPLAGAGDIEDFIAFYDGWVAHGRPEESFEEAAAELRGDD